MKKYFAISLLFIGMIIAVFAINMQSQNSDTKVEIFNRSVKFEIEKNYKKAIGEIINSYDENKNDYLFNLRLSWLYYLSGEYDASIKYYRISSNLKPWAVEPLLGITLPLSAMDKWDEVKKQYEAVLKIDPKNFTANLRLGQIYLNQSDYENAKKYLELVYALYPAEYEPNLSLGWTYYYLGDKNKANELLTNVLMLNSNDTLANEGLELLK